MTQKIIISPLEFQLIYNELHPEYDSSAGDFDQFDGDQKYYSREIIRLSDNKVLELQVAIEFEVDEETGVQLHYGKDYVYGGDFQMDENKTEVYKEPDPKYTHEHNKKLLKIQHNKLMEK